MERRALLLEMLEGVAVSVSSGLAFWIKWILAFKKILLWTFYKLLDFLTVIKLSSFLWIGENFLCGSDVNELFLCHFSFTLILCEVVWMPVGKNYS